MPKLKMYLRTAREMGELHAFIDKNLARGFIQLAKSRMVPLCSSRKRRMGLLDCVWTIGG